MCARFLLPVSDEELAEFLEVPAVPGFVPRYNIAPGEDILIVRQRLGREGAHGTTGTRENATHTTGARENEHAQGGAREVRLVRWGLRGRTPGRPIINARS